MSLEFPVLQIMKNGLLLGCKTDDELESCTPTALRKRYFEGLLLVDRMGRAHEVTDAERVGRIGRFHLFKPNRLRVELHLRPAGTITLEELKARVALELSRQEEFWEEQEDIDEFRQSVANASSIAEVIEKFWFER